MFYLICALINRWVNNREAGDLRRYRAHYDVIVMLITVMLTTAYSIDKYFIPNIPLRTRVPYPTDTRFNNNVVLLRNDVTASFWRNNDVIIISYVIWMKIMVYGKQDEPAVLTSTHERSELYVFPLDEGLMSNNHKSISWILSKLPKHYFLVISYRYNNDIWKPLYDHTIIWNLMVWGRAIIMNFNCLNYPGLNKLLYGK